MFNTDSNQYKGGHPKLQAEQIYEKARALKRRAGSNDPEDVAEHLGIKLYYSDGFNTLKGMYYIVCKRRCIFLNNNLSDRTMRLVMAHEIGHDVLHRHLADSGPFRDFAVFDLAAKPEYEANAFAAHLLIDDEEVFSLAREGYTSEQIASELGINLNLLLIKMTELNKLGYSFNTPYIPKGSFLLAE